MDSFSMKIKDRRVDRIVQKAGYQATHIFYSPIQVWFVFWLIMLILIGMPCIFFFINIIGDLPFDVYSYFVYGLITYFGLGFLFLSYLNHSFVLNVHDFFVVSPNLPFNRLKKYRLSEIKNIKIGTSKYFLPAIVWMTGSNYIEITTIQGKDKYYCSSLEVDCFDENWTEKTLDDLHEQLKDANIHVLWEIED